MVHVRLLESGKLLHLLKLNEAVHNNSNTGSSNTSNSNTGNSSNTDTGNSSNTGDASNCVHSIAVSAKSKVVTSYGNG